MKRLVSVALALLVTLVCAMPAQAALYFLDDRVTAVNTVPPLVVQPQYGNQNQPVPIQAFQVLVSGTSGQVTCTAQILGSNDGVNWINYGGSITASGTSSGVQGAFGSTPFVFFGATVTAISGTGAKCTVTMSA